MMKIKNQILSVFVMFGIIGFIIGFFGLSFTNQIDSLFVDVASDINKQIGVSVEISSYAKRAEGHMMLYILLHDEVDREKFFQRHALLNENINLLMPSMTTSQYAELTHASNQLLHYGQEILKVYDTNNGNFIPTENEEIIRSFHDNASSIRKQSVAIAINHSDIQEQNIITLQNYSSFFTHNILIVTMLVMILPIGAGIFISKKISNPISVLTKAVQKISKGDWNIDLSTTNSNELGFLLNSFQNMASKLKKSETEKNEFVTMITHELKTPLQPIQGYIYLLKDEMLGELNEKQKKAIDEIDASSTNLLKLIENLLSAQKLEMKKMEFDKENVFLVEFMKSIHQGLQSLMLEKKIEFLNTTTITNKDVSVITDDAKLREVFTNLIQNSVDFVSDTNGKIEFGIFDETVQDIVFYVKDNGSGISEKEKENMFTKFWQADTSLNRRHGGSGLGLSICKGYIDGMGGKIWIKNTKGSGLTIYFSLPKH